MRHIFLICTLVAQIQAAQAGERNFCNDADSFITMGMVGPDYRDSGYDNFIDQICFVDTDISPELKRACLVHAKCNNEVAP